MNSEQQSQVADYQTLAALLKVTREKLIQTTITLTEVETLLGLEREKTAALQQQLDENK